MHLGNEAITPECAAITLAAAGAGLGWAAFEARRNRDSLSRVPLAATLGAFTLAAQAWNVPVLAGTSGHLVGGVLLAWALGPGLAVWTMAGVLFLQAVLLGDGGLMAWGANTINMGILPSLCVLAVTKFKREADTRQEVILVAATAACSVVLAAALVCAEIAIGRMSSELSLAAFCQQMLGLHLVLGGLEAALTVPLAMLLYPVVRRDPAQSFARIRILAVLAVVMTPLSVLLSSQLPDGYESAAVATGLTALLTADPSAILAVGAEWLGLAVAVLLAGLLSAVAARVVAKRWVWQAAPANLVAGNSPIQVTRGSDSSP